MDALYRSPARAVANRMHSRDEQTPLLQDGGDQANAENEENHSVKITTGPYEEHASASNELDPASIKRLVRKIDRRILPILFFTFVFNFVDKIVLSSASVYGMTDDIVSAQSRGTVCLLTSLTCKGP